MSTQAEGLADKIVFLDKDGLFYQGIIYRDLAEKGTATLAIPLSKPRNEPLEIEGGVKKWVEVQHYPRDMRIFKAMDLIMAIHRNKLARISETRLAMEEERTLPAKNGKPAKVIREPYLYVTFTPQTQKN
jgi:hypothetical protein